MKHDHPPPAVICSPSQHDLKLCITCDVVHCKKCTKEWKQEATSFTTTWPKELAKRWEGGYGGMIGGGGYQYPGQSIGLYGAQPEPSISISNQPGFSPPVLCGGGHTS